MAIFLLDRARYIVTPPGKERKSARNTYAMGTDGHGNIFWKFVLLTTDYLSNRHMVT
jgi:hypothetical protein